MINLEILKRGFNNIDFREKRPNIYKVIVPFFYEDGDMYDIFIEESPEKPNCIRISDYGLSLMRLSYSFDLDTEHKNDVLEDIIIQNRCNFENGNIYLDINPEQFTGGIYQFAQVISKITNIDIISRETLKSYFSELLEEFIFNRLNKYKIETNISPLNDADLKVDYKIPHKKPLYIFGVNDNSKASKVIITCLKFQAERLPYRSLVIHENFNKLTTFYKNQITNAADKQFTSLKDFQNQGVEYIERELAEV